MMEIKEEIMDFKSKIAESNSQSYPPSVTKNRNDSRIILLKQMNEKQRE
jgi:hypothetical protein